MLKFRNVIGIMAASLMVSSVLGSCDDSDNVGSSLVQDESEVIIANDFQVTGHTVDNSRIQSRTITQVLGRISADGYGAFSSDFVTQFMPSSAIDTENVTVDDIDSLKLLFFVPTGAFVGDSVVPMGLEVYKLKKQLKAPLFSDLDPEDYYDSSDKIGERVYICNALGASDSIKNLSYRMIDVKLPDQLAKDFFNLYLENPEAYAYPSVFAEHFPGIYVKNSYGSGRVVAISNTMIRMYYHTIEKNSDGEDVKTNYYGNYFAVTPEIVLNNNIDYRIDDALQRRIDDGEQVVIAPVGCDVEMTFPIEAIIEYYRKNSGSLSVINSLVLEIPAEAVENEYGIEPPENLLMVQTSKKDEFFANGSLTDDKTSFYAAYDSADNCYRFSGLRSYLLSMLEKDDITADDYTFTLTPVSVETETSSSSSYYGSTTTYVSEINPYVGAPAMATLKLDNATVTFSFARQTVKY